MWCFQPSLIVPNSKLSYLHKLKSEWSRRAHRGTADRGAWPDLGAPWLDANLKIMVDSCSLHRRVDPDALLDMPLCRDFKTLVDPEALRALMANGAAAGPDGWTEDPLATILSDADILQFVTAVTQSFVDGVAPCSRKRVVASHLVGISKPDGGIRPIAVGTIWLKIAARYLLAVHGDAVIKHFSGLQFGCGEENGAEIIIHRARRSHDDGETVCTTDAKNAFNSPCRVALWKAVSALPAVDHQQREAEVDLQQLVGSIVGSL